MIEDKIGRKYDPEYSAEYDMTMSIKQKKTEAEGMLNKLLTAGRQRDTSTLTSKQVEAVLEGRDPSEIKEAKTNWDENVFEARKIVSVYEAADMEQQKKLEVVGMRVDKEICEGETGKLYLSYLRDCYLTLIANGEAVRRLNEIKGKLIDGDVKFTMYLPVLTAWKYGDPSDPQSLFSNVVKEGVEDGIIVVNDVSEIFRRSWFSRGGFKLRGETLMLTLSKSEAEYAREIAERNKLAGMLNPHKRKAV